MTKQVPVAPALRVATAPVNWNNDDAPSLRRHVGFVQMLSEMRQAGYDATEFGSGLPTEAAALGRALANSGLALVSAFCAVPLKEPGALARHGARLDDVADLLRGLGSDLVLLSDAICPERSAWAGRAFEPGAPRLDAAQRATALANVEAICRHLAERGTRVAFHPHAASYVEAPDEVAWLMDNTDPDLLGLCLDTGHLTYGGGDGAEMARTYAGRIRHVHLKDVHAGRLAEARRQGQTFEQALAAYLFPHLGQGIVDFAAVRDALSSADYRGWLVVEQDTQDDGALAAATANRAYVREAFGV